jgi:ABC-type glycerol-3-phosphate transport system substrate-binding protein
MEGVRTRVAMTRRRVQARLFAGAGVLTGACAGPAGGSAAPERAAGARATATLPAVTIRYLNDNAGPRDDVFSKTVIPEFTKKYPQITVQDDPIAFSVLLARIQSEAAADTLADLVRGNARWHRTLIPQKLPLVLDDRLKLSGLPLNELSREQMRMWSDVAGGDPRTQRVYGMPDEIALFATCYAVPLFEQRGLKVPAIGWTKDDLLSLAKELSAPAESRWGWYDLPAAGSELMEGWFAANGGRILSDDLSTSLINSPQNVEVLEFWAGLRNRYHVAPTPAERKIDDWNQGRVAMRFTGPGGIAAIKRDTQVPTALAELPLFKQKGNAIGGGGLFVNARSKAPDAAFALLAHLVSAESQLTVARENGWLPSFSSTLAKYVGAAAPPPANAKAYLDGLPYSVTPSLTLVPGKFNQLNDPFVDFLENRIYKNNESVKTVLDELKAIQDGVLKSPS